MDFDYRETTVKEEPIDIDIEEEQFANFTIRYLEPTAPPPVKMVPVAKKSKHKKRPAPNQMRKRTKNHECLYCKKLFDTMGKLKRHQVHHVKGIKACLECNFTFPSHICFIEHRDTFHLANKPIICAKCPQQASFNTTTAWNRHQRKEHSIFECNQCFMAFSTIGLMKSHKFSHTDPALRTCKFCNMVATSVFRLDEHVSLVHTVDYTQCTMCDKTFVNKSRLSRHMKLRHIGTARRQCEMCGRMSSGIWKLREHTRFCHNPNYDFTCGECLYRFETEWKLQLHSLKCKGNEFVKNANVIKIGQESKVNTRGSPKLPSVSTYECLYCKKTFKFLAALRSHLDQNEYRRCYQCNRCFPSRSCLVNHLKTVHLTDDNPLRCLSCPDLTFSRLYNWTRHRRHDHLIFDCNRCELSFNTLHKHKHHMLNHTKISTCTECNIESSADYVCDHNVRLQSVEMVRCVDCPKLFTSEYSLKLHMRRTHNIHKRYACDQCQRTYARSSSLKDHILIRHNPDDPFLCCDCNCRFESEELFDRHIIHKKCLPYQSGATTSSMNWFDQSGVVEGENESEFII